MIEPWVSDKLAPLRNEPLIILRDPQRRSAVEPVPSTAGPRKQVSRGNW
jgi:hypothetical protein